LGLCIGHLPAVAPLALTLGSMGEHGRSFRADFAQSDVASLRSAFVGGVVFTCKHPAHRGIHCRHVGGVPGASGIALILGCAG